MPRPLPKGTQAGIVQEYRALPVAQLNPYHMNARRGDVDLIAESLSIIGQYRPIVVNRGTATGRPWEILAGNHTWRAAKARGLEFIDCAIVDVDDEAARRIVLVDNKANDEASYDNDALVELLGELESFDGTGWTEEEVERLITPPEIEPEPELSSLLPDTLTVIVDCRNAADQAALLQALEAEGRTCRPG